MRVLSTFDRNIMLALRNIVRPATLSVRALSGSAVVRWVALLVSMICYWRLVVERMWVVSLLRSNGLWWSLKTTYREATFWTLERNRMSPLRSLALVSDWIMGYTDKKISTSTSTNKLNWRSLMFVVLRDSVYSEDWTSRMWTGIED